MVSDAHGCTAVQEAGAGQITRLHLIKPDCASTSLRDAARNRSEPFNYRRKGQMRTITIAAVLVLLAGAADAEPTQLFCNDRGQITGSSSTSGNVTTFRDRLGRMTGTAERMRDGSVQYRDTS